MLPPATLESSNTTDKTRKRAEPLPPKDPRGVCGPLLEPLCASQSHLHLYPELVLTPHVPRQLLREALACGATDLPGGGHNEAVC